MCERKCTLPGRVRYYDKERLSSKPGPTRGQSLVTEHNPQTGQVRQWTVKRLYVSDIKKPNILQAAR